ncbi:MAG: GNAT family N-acetyltransferase [Anaerolineae bacterium]|nr:GNAT family N-acetyltransferase [Anaerolineae bacterium]
MKTMLAATAAERRSAGIRRVSLAHDLRGIADLIELCFGAQMDAGGRAVVREMRGLSQLGPLLPALSLADEMLRGIGKGFVWEIGGQIIGNVTLYSASYPLEMGRVYSIANVATHPDYRRRGIARSLMQTALEAIQEMGGTAVTLQVEYGNDGALELYERLGFRVERVWRRWQRSSSQPAPPRLLNPPHITYRPAHAWREEYAIAERVFPEEQGGLGWQRPLHPREFWRPPLRRLLDTLSGTSLERWVARENGDIAGSLWARTSFGKASTQFTLIVHPAWHGQLEEPLINYGLHRLMDGHRPIGCEHPLDDEVTNAVLERYSFRPRRTVTHMRLDL